MKFPYKLPHKIEERNKMVGLLIGLSLSILFSIFFAAGPLQSLDNWDLDMKFVVRQRWLSKFPQLRKKLLPVNSDLVFIQIDDDTLDWEQTFPDDPIYYLDIVRELGVSGINAMAVLFSINYTSEFGRKVDLDSITSFKDLIGETKKILNAGLQKKETIVGELSSLKDYLKSPGGGKYAKDVALKLEEMIYDQDLNNLQNTLLSVGQFAERNKTLGDVAPNREQLLADEMDAAKNVYFICGADNYINTPYDVGDLKNKAKARKLLEKILRYPTLNRPENHKEGLVYDAYYNLTPDELDILSNEKEKPFDKDIIAHIKKDKKERLRELKEFQNQNKKYAFNLPPEVKNTYIKLRRVKHVHSVIGSKTIGQGIYKTEISSDGKLRKIAPVMIYNGKLYPHIDFLLAMEYLRVKPKDVVFRRNRIILKNALLPRTHIKKDVIIPLSKDGTMFINWAGIWADTTIPFGHKSLQKVYINIGRLTAYKQYQEIMSKSEEERNAILSNVDVNVLRLMKSITKEEAAVLEKEINSFKGKIVIVGLTAVGTTDLNPTPLEPRYPIIGMHANVINTIVENSFIYNVALIFIIIIFFLLAASLGYVGGLIRHQSSVITALINFLIMSVVMSVYLLFNFFLFIRYNITIPLLVPVLLIVFTFLFVFLYRFLTEEQEKKKMKGMFATYVNKEVVESLIEDPDKLKLGGEWMNCTVFFSDIAGFTSISESMSPEQLVELLNEYLTAMTDIIFEHGGTLDKYIGDAIVAVYGAPIPFDDHAIKACLATIEMQKKLAEFREIWKERYKADVTARCGVNTGKMIAGNMGSTKRFNYTVIGENVEFGEHLESGGKNWGTIMSISETTYEQAKEHLIVRWLDIDWLGEKPVKIYEILAKKSEGISDNIKQGTEIYEEGVRLYFMRKWDESIAKLNEVFNYIPGDNPTKKAIGRCEKAKAKPPGEEFDERAAHM